MTLQVIKHMDVFIGCGTTSGVIQVWRYIRELERTSTEHENRETKGRKRRPFTSNTKR